MSFADFERLEQGAGHIELLKGELVRLPPAKLRHNQIGKRLLFLLEAALEKVRRDRPDARWGEAYQEMGYFLRRDPGTWLQPDVSLTNPEQASGDYYLGAPLMAFEIISESETATDLDKKVAEYLAYGAAEVWLIYPSSRHAWVYTAAATARRETQSIDSDLLPGVDIPLDQILL